MNAVAKIEQQHSVVPMQDSGTILQVIARAASDPSVDIDKMQRLMEMHERMQGRQAETEFNAALSTMQTDIPAIAERGNAAGRYTFAKWEDINTVIKPVLQRHGFALSFRTDFTNGIAVTAVLSHSAGHSVSTTILLPADPSGNKNAVQAVASSVAYGKRYTAGALLNLTSYGEDDDAYAAQIERITEEQAATLRDMLEATGSSKAAFLTWLKVDSIEAIPARAYKSAHSALKAKEPKK